MMTAIPVKSKKYLGNSEIIKCQCEGSYDKTNITHHRNTMKHQRWEQLQKFMKENEKLKNLINSQNHGNSQFTQNHGNLKSQIYV